MLRGYNPFSILNYLQTGIFRNYWFETATPTFLIELFKAKRYYIPQIEVLEVAEELVDIFDIDYIEAENLLFQTGYLSIKDVKLQAARNVYTLQYPNMEVKAALNNYILKFYSAQPAVKSRLQSRLYEALMGGEIDTIKEIIQSHYASIPNDWYRKNDIGKYEGYYASVFTVTLRH